MCQKDTRLAKSRDLCKDRGLTHVEVSLSFEKYFPSDRVIENCFNRITQTVSPCLVYSTPFATSGEPTVMPCCIVWLSSIEHARLP